MPWKTTCVIQAKVVQTWKPSNHGFGEILEIIFADKNHICRQKGKYLEFRNHICFQRDFSESLSLLLI